jgi:hypothetical protein
VKANPVSAFEGVGKEQPGPDTASVPRHQLGYPGQTCGEHDCTEATGNQPQPWTARFTRVVRLLKSREMIADTG